MGEESSIGSVESPPVVGSIAPVDAVAFEDFYRAHYPRIVRLLLASTGRIDLAEELAQDAFASAHRHWSKVSAYAEPGAWVRRVALNAATSAWRRRSNEGAAVKRLGSRRESNPLPAEDERVWAAVRRLPRRQAQVMMLIAIEDLSVAAVATCLAISENSVRTHIRRARETLARELGTDEEMEP